MTTIRYELFYLRFHDEDWYEQLGDFYRTDVEVPADLIVDGVLYQSVGVRFRGSSSYFTVENEKSLLTSLLTPTMRISVSSDIRR